MGTVRVSCNNCPGDFELNPWEVSATGFSDGRDGFYQFRCPKVEQHGIVVKSAVERILWLLEGAGVTVTRVNVDSMHTAETRAEQQRIAETQGQLVHDEILNLGLLSIDQFNQDLFQNLGELGL